MVLKEIKRWLLISFTYVFIYFIAVVFSFTTLISSIFSWLRSPTGSYSLPKRRELPPACLNDPVYGQHCYIQIKNIKLHYVENGDKTKPMMLFLHGFPDFWYSWRHQIKHFSKYYWTVAVDLRGYGDSEKPAGVSQYKIKYLLNDIKNLITALGREKCILVAHDWGGIIGWYFLLKYPEMIEKYVMINIHPIFATSFKWVQFFKYWYIFVFQLPYLPELYLSLKDMEIFNKLLKGFSHDDIEAYKFTFGKPGEFTYGINYYRANIITLNRSYTKKLIDIKMPKGLLIYTDNDHYIHVSNFKEAKTEIENLQTSFIKSASHFLHQRKHEDTNKIISKFLDIEIRIGDDPGKGKSVQPDDASS